MARANTFHPDPSLPPGERAELSGYARSGFDRGHMSPSGDIPDEWSQDESFSLANMIPRTRTGNRRRKGAQAQSDAKLLVYLRKPALKGEPRSAPTGTHLKAPKA